MKWVYRDNNLPGLIIIFILIILLLPINGFAGGSGFVVKTNYEPLLQSKGGRIHGCGMHFKSAVKHEKRLFIIVGSLNEHYFQGKLPSISFKLLVNEFVKGKLVLHRISSGFIKGSNYSSNDFFFNQSSAETGAWLALTDFSKKPKIIPVFIQSLLERPWVGFNLGDDQNDITFQLPRPKNKNAFTDIFNCSKQAMKQVLNELSK